MKHKMIIFCITVFTIKNYAVSQIPKPNGKMKELKILSWNIYMLPYVSLFNNNGERAKVIASRLQNSDCDIFVFQEAFSSKCRNIISKGLMHNYPYQYGPINESIIPFITNSGLWIVSKIPLLQLGKIQFSNSTGFDAVASKGAVLFEGCINGSCFQLLGTHLQADHLSKIRNQQCTEIREHLLNPNYRADTPQFICGDFNISRNDSLNYKQMLKTLDAQNGKISGTIDVTYDGINNTLAKMKTIGKSKVVDYILVRNGQLIKNIERKVQPFLAKINGIESNLSDHYGVECTISFNDASDINSKTQMAWYR